MAFEVSLGGVALSKHIIWTNQYSYTKVRQSYQETLGGGVRVHAETVEAGVPITLESQSSGWLTRSMVEQVNAMANIAGGIFELKFGSFTANVMFAHHGGSSFTYDPISFKMDGGQDDWFQGSIQLITV